MAPSTRKKQTRKRRASKKRSRKFKKSCDSSKLPYIKNNVIMNQEIIDLRDKIHNILLDFNVPINQERSNVRRENEGPLRSVIFGDVFCWGASIDPKISNTRRIETSRNSKNNPSLHKLLFKFGRALTNKKYSSVCLNDSYQMAKHKDSNNVGDSFIVGLGNYRGGELRIFDENGNKHHDIDIRNKGVFFNGYEMYHEVMKFWGGKRYSLVYYNI